MRDARRALGWALLALGLAACVDLRISRPAMQGGGHPIADPSFAVDVQPILSESCAFSAACHAGANPQLGLALDSGRAYGAVVRVRAASNPAFLLVKPLDADSSWLIRRLEASAERRGGLSRMPLNRQPLDDAVIQTIRNWIGNGANDN